MRVGYLVVIIKEGQELSHMIEVILGNFGEAELIEVAEGNCWEGEVCCRHLVQLSDVRILQII